MADVFQIYPIGVIRKDDDAAWIEIFEGYADALLGLAGFSHINVLFWFDQNDTVEKRRILRVHPRGDQSNPLSGVFATHSPARPNLIGLTRCKVLSIKKNRIQIKDIDALDGTPVIDIKCHIPDKDQKDKFTVPNWV